MPLSLRITVVTLFMSLVHVSAQIETLATFENVDGKIYSTHQFDDQYWIYLRKLNEQKSWWKFDRATGEYTRLTTTDHNDAYGPSLHYTDSGVFFFDYTYESGVAKYYINFLKTNEELTTIYLPNVSLSGNDELIRQDDKVFLTGTKNDQVVFIVSDGTSSGTITIPLTNVTQVVGSLITYDGKFYFHAIKNGEPVLVASDGTASGTAVILLSGFTITNNYGLRGNNGKIYFTVRANGINYLMESNGTVSGTSAVYQASTDINISEGSDNVLLLCIFDGANTLVYRYSSGSSPALMKTIPGGYNWGRFSKIAQNNGFGYFNFFHGGQHYSLWKSDLTEAGTQLFIDSVQANSLVFNGSEFTMNVFQRGDTADPQNYAMLPFATGFDPTNIAIDRLFEGGYYRMTSNKYGIELGCFTADDSLSMIKDLAVGPNSGFTGEVEALNGYSFHQYSSLLGADSSFYAFMTNGNDSLVYLYRTKDGQMESLFSISNPEQVTLDTADSGGIQWFEKNPETNQLFYRRFDFDSEFAIQPTEKPIADPEVWNRQIAFPDDRSYYWNEAFDANYSKDMRIDEDGGIISLFFFRYLENKIFVSATMDTLAKPSGNINVFKHDRYGKVLWNRSFGDDDMVFREEPVMDLDNDGNIIVFGNYFQKAMFGNDSLTSPRSCYFLLKVNGQTGAIEWYRKLKETYYTDDIEIDGITVDNENRIYLAFMYRHFDLTMDGHTVHSNVSPVNTVAAYTPDGHMLWLTNMQTPWTNDYGKTRFFDYSEQTNSLTAVQAQGYYNTSSSCEYMDWGYQIQTIDLEGNILDSYPLTSSDLGSITTGFISETGRFNGIGYFRGELEAGKFDFQSPVLGSCHATLGFHTEYELELREVTQLGISGDRFLPLDAHYYDDHIYLYGTEKNKELILIKLDKNWQQIGYKRLGQYADLSDFETGQFFDVKNGYIVFFGSNFKKNASYDVNPLIVNANSKWWIKIKDENWSNDITWFLGIQPFSDSGEQDLVVYPNPFDDKLMISLLNTNLTRVEIYDSSGRKVAEQKLGSDTFQQIDLPDLSEGLYVARFSGEGLVIDKKLLKMN